MNFGVYSVAFKQAVALAKKNCLSDLDQLLIRCNTPGASFRARGAVCAETSSHEKKAPDAKTTENNIAQERCITLRHL